MQVCGTGKREKTSVANHRRIFIIELENSFFNVTKWPNKKEDTCFQF